MTIAVAVDQQRDLSCLGASEAAGVLGLDKYDPPIAIWRRHRGMTVRDDGPQEAAYWGTVLEPVIRGKYAFDRQVRVWVPTGSYTMDGWLRCTPDGLVEELARKAVGTFEYDPSDADPDFPSNSGLVSNLLLAGLLGDLQVKTCSAWLEDAWRDGPPAKYEVQCRVEMAVLDIPWCDIVCLCGGQKQIGPLRIERDRAIEDRILTSLQEFWGMVKFGKEPTGCALPTDDPDLHKAKDPVSPSTSHSFASQQSAKPEVPDRGRVATPRSSTPNRGDGDASSSSKPSDNTFDFQNFLDQMKTRSAEPVSRYLRS